MILNPKKYVFGVESGKFLGFLIDQRGIEANLGKIQDVLDMKSPRTIKEVQRLTGYLAALVDRPQANGQVEAYNKLISNGIKRKLEKARGLWVDELVNVLWSIRTTTKSSTGENPFFLVCGAEAVLPIEMYEPTLRVMLYDETANWEAMKTALNFLTEAMGNAALRHKIYRLRMTRAYNRRVLKCPLKMGDLVLRKIEVVGRANEDGKLTPNWEGPYRISEEV
ncbi:uncharacterized protein LOC110734083 [Chenopodium quinoa]|uniref:uncharacterized protein LOC110734083 n=1 Tax=Chenopodium quinoa TaxID=63459 RepID=UPI000B7846AB|nr:uncharacterized protein LOC110734083 [Chenopodium quinoa]